MDLMSISFKDNKTAPGRGSLSDAVTINHSSGSGVF